MDSAYNSFVTFFVCKKKDSDLYSLTLKSNWKITPCFTACYASFYKYIANKSK